MKIVSCHSIYPALLSLFLISASSASWPDEVGEHSGGAAVFSSPSVVQTDTSGASSTATRNQTSEPVRRGVLEEIIVTATKREESLQDVSIAVTAITGTSLEELGIDKWDDVQLPAVHVGTGIRNESLFIRGIGSGTNDGFEQSVPLYIDGSYYGRSRGIVRIGFLDLDRIEVLKGPQPTFFGKNAIGGALSLTSRRPTDDFEGTIEVSNEFNHDEISVFGAVSGPVTESFKARAAIKYRDMDGWMNNVTLDRQEPNEEDILMRFSAVWDVTEDVEVFAKFEYLDSEVDGRQMQLVRCGIANPAVAGRIDPATECQSDRNNAGIINPAALAAIPDDAGNSNYLDNTEFYGGSVEINWDINGSGYILTSQSSWYETDYDLTQMDFDANPLDVISFVIQDDYKLFGQELRIQSPQGKRLEWLAGAWYGTEDLSTRLVADIYVFGTVPPVAVLNDRRGRQDTDDWALFGEISYRILDPLTLKFGFRYAEVKKETPLNAQLVDTVIAGVPQGVGAFPPAIFPFSFTDERKDTDFQPSVTMEWRPTANYMFYAARKEGFKAGGFDFSSITPPPSGVMTFEPEKVTSYEVGARLTMLDETARLNITLFHSDYEDLQVSTFNTAAGFGTITGNAAEVKSQGLELEGAWAVTDQVTLNAAITWLDSEYDSFPQGPCYPGQPVAPGECQLTAPGPPPTFTQDLQGTNTAYAPEWSGNIGLSYRQPLDQDMFGFPLLFTANVNAFLTSEYFNSFDGDPNTLQSGFSKIDARIALSDQGGKWELAFFGRNLTNKLTTHNVFAAPFGPFGTGVAYLNLLDRSRQLGIQASYNF